MAIALQSGCVCVEAQPPYLPCEIVMLGLKTCGQMSKVCLTTANDSVLNEQ